MKSEEADKICVICYCNPEESILARIECCAHIFCYECIKDWATKGENSCPLCK